MVPYEDFLKKLSVKELKTIVKAYLKHVKIRLTKVKKGELIEHLLKHTTYENGEIVTKSDLIDNLDLDDVISDIDEKKRKTPLTEKQLKDKEDKARKEYSKVSGLVTRLEREYNNLVYDSVYEGGKGKKKDLNDKEKVEAKKLENELDKANKKLKVLMGAFDAIRKYRKDRKSMNKEKKEEKKEKKEKKEVIKKGKEEVKKTKKVEGSEDFKEDDEFKKRKELIRLKAKFDRLKKDLEEEKDSKKIKAIEKELDEVRKEYSKKKNQ
jgi:hypothetical protein